MSVKLRSLAPGMHPKACDVPETGFGRVHQNL